MAKHEGAPRPHHRIEADEAAHLSARRRQHAANQAAHRARAEQASQAERAPHPSVERRENEYSWFPSLNASASRPRLTPPY